MITARQNAVKEASCLNDNSELARGFQSYRGNPSHRHRRAVRDLAEKYLQLADEICGAFYVSDGEAGSQSKSAQLSSCL